LSKRTNAAFLSAYNLDGVLVQPEMERGRSPLVSIPPFGREFSSHRYDHQAILQRGCVPAKLGSVSPGKIIVAPPRPSISTSEHPEWMSSAESSSYRPTSRADHARTKPTKRPSRWPLRRSVLTEKNFTLVRRELRRNRISRHRQSNHRPMRILSPNTILPTTGLFPNRSIHGYNSHEEGEVKCAV